MATTFTIVRPGEVRRAELVPDGPGIYAILMPDGHELLGRWGYNQPGVFEVGTLRGYPVMYLGSTLQVGLSKRLAHHAFGDSRKSSLRSSLGVLLQDELELTVVTTPGQCNFHFGDGETRLSAWIADHLLFAYKERRNPLRSERLLIGAGHPPLNIVGQKRSPFARRLMALREKHSGRWQG